MTAVTIERLLRRHPSLFVSFGFWFGLAFMSGLRLRAEDVLALTIVSFAFWVQWLTFKSHWRNSRDS